MTEPMDLKTFMRQEVAQWESIGGGGGATVLKELMLRHGTSFRGRHLPRAYERGTPSYCFANAAALAERSGGALAYCEGYGWLDGLCFPTHHAWCVDREGKVVEVTWNKPAKREYLGIIIPTPDMKQMQAWTGSQSCFLRTSEMWEPRCFAAIDAAFAEEHFGRTAIEKRRAMA